MKFRLAPLTAAVLAAVAAAQVPPGVITRALEPAADDLARLNLVPQWRIYLPVESGADSIATVQPFGDQVFVQLTSGRLGVVQADNDPKTHRRAGDVLWIYRPERPPGVVRPLAVGPTEGYVIQGQRLLILDRADGKLKYAEEVDSTGAAAPAADSFAVYLPLDNRGVVAYSHVAKVPGYRPAKPYEAPDPVHRMSLIPEPADALSTPQNRSPSIARLEVLRPPFRRGTDTIDSSVSVGMLRTLRPPYREVENDRSPSVGALPNLRDVYEQSSKEAQTRIKYLWTLLAGGKIDTTPLLTVDPQLPESERVHVVSGRTLLTALRESRPTANIETTYIAEAEISAPLTSFNDYLYLATADSNFISLSIREVREPSTAANTLPRGKFTTGGMVVQKPLLTEDSVYVVGERWGLIRLKHGTLDPMWQERLVDGRVRARPNADVARLLSVSSTYCYGLNREGKLVVVDAVPVRPCRRSTCRPSRSR